MFSHYLPSFEPFRQYNFCINYIGNKSQSVTIAAVIRKGVGIRAKICPLPEFLDKIFQFCALFDLYNAEIFWFRRNHNFSSCVLLSYGVSITETQIFL